MNMPSPHRVLLLGLLAGFVAPSLNGQEQSVADIMGVTLSEASETDFMTFFSFARESENVLVDGRTITQFRPFGSFEYRVRLSSIQGSHGAIYGQTLFVNREFIENAATAHFGRDVVGSFVSAVAPSSHSKEGSEFGALIKEGVSTTVAAVMGDDHPIATALATIEGREGFATVEWAETIVTFKNAPKDDGVPTLIVRAVSTRSAGEHMALGTNTPEDAVGQLFVAARGGSPDGLARLCDPLAENDGDTERICALSANTDEWTEFVEWFRAGRVSGPVEIVGDEATVGVVFGPVGERAEEMELIKRGRRWYLAAF